MNAKVGMADSGMASAEIAVARPSRRKNPHHDDCQDRALNEGVHGRVILLFRVVHGVEHLGHGHLRILFLDLLQLLLDGRHDGDVGGALAFATEKVVASRPLSREMLRISPTPS